MAVSIASEASGHIEVDGIYYNLEDDNAIVCGSSKTDVIILDTIVVDSNRYTVESICDEAFSGSSIEQLVIPSSIVHIGCNVLKSASHLESVVFEHNVAPSFEYNSLAIDSKCTFYSVQEIQNCFFQYVGNSDHSLYTIDGPATVVIYEDPIHLHDSFKIVPYNSSFFVDEVPMCDICHINGWSDGNRVYAIGERYITDCQRVVFSLIVDEKTYVARCYVDNILYREYYVSINHNVPLPEDVEKIGYTFCYWECTVLNDGDLIEYEAIFEVNQYCIYYYDSGHRTIKKYDYGAEIAPYTKQRTGYTFVGWSPALPCSMPAEDLIVEAIWSPNSYDLTFNLSGGWGISSISLEYGATVIVLDEPIRTGYSFLGWEPALPETMPAKNIEPNFA